jgi:hypothetical protein
VARMLGRREATPPAHRVDRRGRLVAVAIAICALVALGASAATPAAPVQLLPDLVTRAPMQLYVQGNDLRLSNTIANKGVGPLEIFPEPNAGGDCDGDGDDANDRLAFQRVFEDSSNPNSSGYFIRSQDTVSSTQLVGCMAYHPAHGHWHVEDFSVYTLKRESTGLLAGRSSKISFCVVDTDHLFPARPGSPAGGYYGDAGCGPSSVEGMSIGWADTYGAYLDGQSIPISGLPAADYCLISRADPANRFDESNDTNNAHRTRIHLDPAAQDVQVLSGPCQLGA